MKETLAKLEGDLLRLRDPLAKNVPFTRLESDPAVHDVLSKAQISIKNLLGLKKK